MQEVKLLPFLSKRTPSTITCCSSVKTREDEREDEEKEEKNADGWEDGRSSNRNHAFP